MKQVQDISVVVVGFLTFALIGYFIHTLAKLQLLRERARLRKNPARF